LNEAAIHPKSATNSSDREVGLQLKYIRLAEVCESMASRGSRHICVLCHEELHGSWARLYKVNVAVNFDMYAGMVCKCSSASLTD
jgi:hypothetical protein